MDYGLLVQVGTWAVGIGGAAVGAWFGLKGQVSKLAEQARRAEVIARRARKRGEAHERRLIALEAGLAYLREGNARVETLITGMREELKADIRNLTSRVDAAIDQRRAD